MSGLSGYKQPIKSFSEVFITGPDTMDLHSWVDIDDKIFDYNDGDIKYKKVKKANKLTGKMIRVKMPIEEKKKAFRHIYKKIIKPRIEFLAQMADPELTKAAIHEWHNESGHCFLRAFVMSKILGSKAKEITFDKIFENPKILLNKDIPCVGLQLGSAGWKNKKTGKVWYEFG